MSEVSPTARALRTLEILQSRPGCTAGELAERLGVTDRAARRYVAILREAGIPVESVRGPYGGYRLGRGLRLPALVFTAAEALGLVMAVLDGRHAAADNEDPVGSGLGKIIRALPVHVGRQAATMREHARAVPDRWAKPDPDITSALVEAVGEKRQVRIGYRSAAGHTHTFDVDPWSVVVRYGRWYLLCFAHHADAVRTYRIDRVTEVGEGTRSFETPEGLDPVAVLEENLASGWAHETRVVIHAPLADVAPYLRPTMGRLEALDEERCVVVGSTSNAAMYAGEWLAGLPFELTVEGGPELRAAVAEVAARLGRSLDYPREGPTLVRRRETRQGGGMSNRNEGDFGQTDMDAAERANAEINLDEPSATDDEPWSPPDRQPRGAEMAEVEDETFSMRIMQEEPDPTATIQYGAEPTTADDDPDAIPADRDVLGGDADGDADEGDRLSLDDETGPEAAAMHLE